jgi:hypothetical protein
MLMLIKNLDKNDIKCFRRSNQILCGDDLSDNQAKFLIDNSAKLLRTINTLLERHIATLELASHDHTILQAFIQNLMWIKECQALSRVGDQMQIDMMENRI